LRSAVLLRFYEACVREALNETTYVAAEAGLRFMLNASLDGVTLATEGWDESAGRLLDAVVPSLVNLTLRPDRFDALKDRLLRELSAAETADAYLSVRETRRALVREFYATPADMLPLARQVTLAQVQQFARTLFTQGRLEALAFGNLGPDVAAAAVRRAAAQLHTRPLPAAQLLRTRMLVEQPGSELRSHERLKVNNSVLRREYVLGDDSPAARATADVIGAIVAEPFFGEMRTRQQLGYIVQSVAFVDERQTVALFQIQSGDYAADELERRADAFIRTLPELVRQMPADNFAAVVDGVRSRLLERDKSIAERAQRLFALAYDRRGDWARTEATVAALDRLSQAEVAQRLQQALDPASRRLRNFLGFARDHAMPATLPPAVTERSRWKRGQRYE
jgi:insulysin